MNRVTPRAFITHGQTLNLAGILICSILLLLGCERTAQSSSQRLAGDAGSPTPRSRCWIYDKIYPATEAAYESQHVTLAERKAIERWAAPASPSQNRLVRARSPWAKPPSASERKLVRWMRDSDLPEAVIVFVARPIKRPGKFYAPWIALNANVIINTVLCTVSAYPPE
jgi:hypothetical protein